MAAHGFHVPAGSRRLQHGRIQPLWGRAGDRALGLSVRRARTSGTANAIGASMAAAVVAATWTAPLQAETPGRITNVVQLGECMFDAHRKLALGLINAETAAQSDAALTKLKDEKTCFKGLPNELTLDASLSNYSKGLLRGTIAEAALRTARGASALSALPFEQKRYVRAWFQSTGRDPAVDEMSTCVADTDPQGISALLSTSPDTVYESYALGQLQPWLVKCLSVGSRVEAERTALRAALADALYQRLRNPALSAPAAKTTEVSK